MIGIVIVAHGGLAREYLAAVEHVVGAQPAMQAISIEADANRADKQAEICAAADAVDSGDGVGADATPLEGSWTPGAAGAEAPQMRAPPPPQKQMEQWGL